jgi:hypothetical protein
VCASAKLKSSFISKCITHMLIKNGGQLNRAKSALSSCK